MYTLSIALITSLLVSTALSNELAGPFESVMIWYAYRMDVLMSGADNLLFAPGCYGSLPDHSCKFDELMEYLQAGSRWEGPSGVGDNLDPVVLDAANGLRQSNFPNVHVPEKLLPEYFSKGQSMSYGKLFGTVVNVVQEIRRLVPNWQDPNHADVPIRAQLDNFRLAAANAHGARLAAQASFMIAGLHQLLNDYGWHSDVVTKDVTFPNLGTWTQIDVERTLRTHGFDDPGHYMYNAINTYISNFNSDDDNAIHLRSIQAAASNQDRVFRDPTC